MCSVLYSNLKSEKLTLDRSSLLYAHFNSVNTQGKEGGEEGKGGVRKGEGEGGEGNGNGKAEPTRVSAQYS